MSLFKLLLALATVSLCWAWDPPNFTRPKRANDGISRAPMRRRTPPPPSTAYAPASKKKKKPAPTPEGVGTTPFMRDLSYLITLELGYPEQQVSLAFDTGSSAVWVNPSCSQYAAFGFPTYYQACLADGFYLTQQTETGRSLNSTDNISYGSGFVEVEYWSDSVSFPETNGSSFKLRHAQFGVAQESLFLETGIFGAAPGKGYNQNYSGFIDLMYEQGFIQDKDFSVALGAVDDQNGEVVFGGYDTSKFTGYLQKLPLLPQLDDDTWFRYWVNCTYVGVTPSYGCESYPVSPTGWSDRMLLDTGTSLIYLPETIFYNLVTYFTSATYNYDEGLYEVPCDALWQKGSVDFEFGGNLTVQVPIHEFIYVVEAMPENNYTQVCFLGVQPSFGMNIGGDVLLRSLYLLFRQQDKSIYMAQASNCGTNIVSSHNVNDDVWGDCDGAYGGPDDFNTICDTASYSPYTTAVSSDDAFSMGRLAHATAPPLPGGPMPTHEADRSHGKGVVRRDNGAPGTPAAALVVAATTPTNTGVAATGASSSTLGGLESTAEHNSSASGFKTSSRKPVSPISMSSTWSTSSAGVTVPLASSRNPYLTTSESLSESKSLSPSSSSPLPEPCDSSSSSSTTTTDYNPPSYSTTPEGYPPLQPTSTSGAASPMTTIVESLVCYPTDDSARLVIRVTPGQTIIVSDDQGSETFIDGSRAFTAPLAQNTGAGEM